MHVVIDLRGAKGVDKIAVDHLGKCFVTSGKARRLYIITKQCQLVDFMK